MPWVGLQCVVVGFFDHLLFNAEEFNLLKQLILVSACKHNVNNSITSEFE